MQQVKMAIETQTSFTVDLMEDGTLRVDTGEEGPGNAFILTASEE